MSDFRDKLKPIIERQVDRGYEPHPGLWSASYPPNYNITPDWIAQVIADRKQFNAELPIIKARPEDEPE